MNITQKRLAAEINKSVSILEMYLCRAEFAHIEKYKIKNKRAKAYKNVTCQDIKRLKDLAIRPKAYQLKEDKKVMQKQEYDNYYKQKTMFNQVAADCFDFNFSYDPDNQKTCYLNFEHPKKCKVLNSKYCCMLANQLGERK